MNDVSFQNNRRLFLMVGRRQYHFMCAFATQSLFFEAVLSEYVVFLSECKINTLKILAIYFALRLCLSYLNSSVTMLLTKPKRSKRRIKLPVVSKYFCTWQSKQHNLYSKLYLKIITCLITIVVQTKLLLGK